MGRKPKNFSKKHKSSSVYTYEEVTSNILFDLINDGHKPIRIDQILRILGVARKQKSIIEEMLLELVEQGRILHLHGGQWVSSSQVRTMTGKYSVQRSGAAYVDSIKNDKHSTQKSSSSHSTSVFIHPSQAGEAWHGDIVRAAILPGKRTHDKKNSKPEGRIVEVIERKVKELTVRVLHGGKEQKHASNFVFCKPADTRFPLTLRLEHVPKKTQHGELLLVRPIEQLASNLWEAEYIASIGHEENISVQENLVKLNHNAPNDFPPAALREAEAFANAPQQVDLQGREDVCHLPFVTIDGETARDFDDAIYVQSLPNDEGWCLHVGIADVSHYVHPRSALDKEAQVRGNSWYFPCSVEPMLPKTLSTGLCSLNPHEPRLIMLAKLYISPNGTVQKSLFSKACMCSKARLTYNQVKELVIDKNEKTYTDFLQEPNAALIMPMLEVALKLAKVLAATREQRGSLDFHMPEPEYIFDEKGRINDIKRKQNHFAHQMIEEFMVATNEAVARFLTEKSTPLLYRTHPAPDDTQLNSLFRTLQTTSIAQDLPKRPNAASLQNILHAAKDSSQEFLISRLTLRTMAQARYHPENIGHFGLASTNYCHFTSPIRRYADLVVHRALKHALGLDRSSIPTEQKLIIIGDKLNHCERAAIDAEREMAKRLAVLVLQDRIGEGFDGVICGVSDFGIFVELKAMPIEGMIRIRDLGDDFFEYDVERQELIGVMHGTVYRLGQNIRTRLLEVNLGRLEITLGLVQDKKSQSRRKKYIQKPKKHSEPRHVRNSKARRHG